ncbi:hypothetical protein ACFL5O_03290 [Myxococcota bacterium]
MGADANRDGKLQARTLRGEPSGHVPFSAVFTIPADVKTGAGPDGEPGFELWLESAANSGEVFRVNRGTVRGTANGTFPFSFNITGDLDCTTKRFVGKVEDGQYSVGPLEYEFTGDVTADYDKIRNKLINGTWTGVETPNPLWPFPAGGSAVWEATWAAQ